jgi:hypothetical protein
MRTNENKKVVKNAKALSTRELGEKLLEELRSKEYDPSLIGQTFVRRVSSFRSLSESKPPILPFKRTKDILFMYLLHYKMEYKVLEDRKEMMHCLEEDGASDRLLLFLNPEGKNVQMEHSRKQGFIFLGVDERGNWVSKGILGKNESSAEYWTTVNNQFVLVVPDREQLEVIVGILEKVNSSY